MGYVRGPNNENILEVKDNAFLVAAAPELLAFVREVHREVTSSRFTDRAGWGKITANLIAKAKGAQS